MSGRADRPASRGRRLDHRVDGLAEVVARPPPGPAAAWSPQPGPPTTSRGAGRCRGQQVEHLHVERRPSGHRGRPGGPRAPDGGHQGRGRHADAEQPDADLLLGERRGQGMQGQRVVVALGAGEHDRAHVARAPQRRRHSVQHGHRRLGEGVLDVDTVAGDPPALADRLQHGHRHRRPGLADAERRDGVTEQAVHLTRCPGTWRPGRDRAPLGCRRAGRRRDRHRCGGMPRLRPPAPTGAATTRGCPRARSSPCATGPGPGRPCGCVRRGWRAAARARRPRGGRERRRTAQGARAPAGGGRRRSSPSSRPPVAPGRSRPGSSARTRSSPRPAVGAGAAPAASGAAACEERAPADGGTSRPAAASELGIATGPASGASSGAARAMRAASAGGTPSRVSRRMTTSRARSSGP